MKYIRIKTKKFLNLPGNGGNPQHYEEHLTVHPSSQMKAVAHRIGDIKEVNQMNIDNTYKSAVMRRRTYPLNSGLYKLRESQGHIHRFLHTVNKVMQTRSVRYDEPLGGCMRSEAKGYVASIPKNLAELLGYNIAPAIQALVGDGLTQKEISNLHPDFRIRVLLSRCKLSGRSNIRIKQLLEHFDDALCEIIDYAEQHKRY